MAHVFNLTSNGTNGFLQRGADPGKARSAGQVAVIFTPEASSYRMNIGVRSLSGGATLTATHVDGKGQTRATVTKNYAANWFEQVDVHRDRCSSGGCHKPVDHCGISICLLRADR